MNERRSGVLMHISSLPGKFGIGTFGQSAYDFVDFLVETKQTYWQVLPLTTTSYGDSPYQSFSAIAGNPHFIDFDLLTEAGWLQMSDYQQVDFGSDPEMIDYALLFEVRRPILAKAVKNFLADQSVQSDFKIFQQENESWLTDYAEFMAIKEHFGQRALQEWDDKAIITRQQKALVAYRQKLATQIEYFKVIQYFFFSQWAKLKDYANRHQIQIIGDMPIYVAGDSVEVWTKPELFKLDKQRKPTYVAGVPADNFSADGQLWGNPLYDWAEHQKSGYAWWIYRIRESFKLYDILRIDHFKGFSDYWQVKGDAKVAKYGSWQAGPHYPLFKAIKQAVGNLPIIAEDLGNIDDKARDLLEQCGFPGMKIVQFGLDDRTGQSLDSPHHYIAKAIAYTGTHDNDVINGWYQKLSPAHQQYVNDYTHRQPNEAISQALLRVLFASVCHTVIATMQDILDLPAHTRMNTPSTIGQNWQWRMKMEDLTAQRKAFLIKITELYQRSRKGNENA